MRRWLTLAIIQILATLMLGSCATSQRSTALTTTLNAYANAVRWGDIEQAALFLDPKLRAAQPLSAIELQRYKQVRVSEYDEGNGPVPTGENEVKQTVQINLINNHTQGERGIIDHQTWHYDAASKHWWLTSGLPDITRD